MDVIYQEFVWLSQEIRKQDEFYYNNNQAAGTSESLTSISDEEYDALVRREEALSQEYPDLLRKLQQQVGMGTQATRAGRVGTAVPLTTSRIKQKHRQSMLSLENVHDTTQLLAWLERVRKKFRNDDSMQTISIKIEPKIDGSELD